MRNKPVSVTFTEQPYLFTGIVKKCLKPLKIGTFWQFGT